MSSRRIQGVVFDLDGVLADSEGLHVRAWQGIAREFALPLDRLPLEEWVGHPDSQNVKDIVRTFGLNISPAQLLERKRRIFMRLVAGELRPFPGVVEALGRLDSLPLAVATSSARREAELMLQVIGLRERFRFVVTRDDVSRPKPSPEGYRLAADRLAAVPGCCVAVEDSAAGVEAARRAGLVVLAVSNSQAPEKLSAAHYLFPSTAAAIDWIEAAAR